MSGNAVIFVAYCETYKLKQKRANNGFIKLPTDLVDNVSQ